MNMKDSSIAAKEASIKLAAVDTQTKNRALKQVAESLDRYRIEIIDANEKDINRSEKENLAKPLLKRLKFDNKKIDDCIKGINSLISIPDPVGKTQFATLLDEDLELYKVSCPIGVIGVIFESRPDALVQISTLCLKSGNSVLLKGGSEAKETNKILASIINEASTKAAIPTGWIQLLETREDVNGMLKLDEYIDLLIPRGSNEFVRYIMDNSKIPVLGHADGICHCYVDEKADIDMGIKVVVDSKTQYVAVCNAAETLLINNQIASKLLPALKIELDKKDVQIAGCDKTAKIIEVEEMASEEDWKAEYLDYKISIKVVNDINEAIDHINKYGSGHTDAIITSNKENASMFMNLVDSGNVLWNCSTRFSDGFRYGFGAEVGISTNKIHARGPVGLEGLLIYKYKLIGNGNVVSDYSNNTKSFIHKKIDKEFNI